jgi:hypothetical protein
MANTMVKIQTITVGASGSASIEFSNIPQTFTDLKILLSTRANRPGEQVDLARITFNDSASGYSKRDLYGDYTAVYTSTNTGQSSYIPQGFSPASSATASVFSSNEIYISNYASSNFKSVSTDIVTENNSTTANHGYLTISSGLWSNTAAITKITIANHLGTGFAQFSSATLYGIKKA